MGLLYFVMVFVLSVFILAWWYISSCPKLYEMGGAVGGLAAKVQSRVGNHFR
jgi:hypothetical protein